MAKAYCQDLRERGLDAVEMGGMSRRGAADRFGVSEPAAIKWVERTGLRTASQMGGHKPRKLPLTGNLGGPRGRTSRSIYKKVCLDENCRILLGRQNRVIIAEVTFAEIV
jgi:hypothetical protein